MRNAGLHRQATVRKITTTCRNCPNHQVLRPTPTFVVTHKNLFVHKIILFIIRVGPNIGHKIAAISCATAQEKVEDAGTSSVHPAAVVLGNVSSQLQTRLCGCFGSDGACLLCQQRLELRIQKQAVMKQVTKEVAKAMLEHLTALGRRGLFCPLPVHPCVYPIHGPLSHTHHDAP
jgi:hypothetical protein